MKYTFLSILFIISSITFAQEEYFSHEEEGMTIEYVFIAETIYFELTAPTQGWLAIGFNETHELAGNYLIMGNVHEQKVTIQEHYTYSFGNYKSFKNLGIASSLSDQMGIENISHTKISFSLPVKASSTLARSFCGNPEYILTMAYSLHDDFQHHSIMRTAIRINM